jgi:hypothetical protein
MILTTEGAGMVEGKVVKRLSAQNVPVRLSEFREKPNRPCTASSSGAELLEANPVRATPSAGASFTRPGRSGPCPAIHRSS